MKKQLILSTFLYFSILTLQDIAAQENQVQKQVQQKDETAEKKILTLKEIDRLIKDKEYNLALSELTSYMRANPTDFDRAQKRIKKIMDIRNLYDERAEKLAEMMKEDSEAGDDKTTTNSYTEEARASDHEKLELILQLENHEKNQTETATELTRQARKALALRFYIDRYNRIMQEGHKLLNDGKYEDALAKFEEGFDLKKSDSDKIYTPEVPDGIPVVYEEDITQPVAEHLEKIGEIAGGFSSARSECEDAYREFIRAVQKEDYQAAITANEKVHSSYKKYAQIRNSIQKETNELRKIENSVVKKTPALAEINYISFTLGFIEGDKGYSETGILGIMDYFWNNTVEDMKTKLYELTYSNLKKIQDTLPPESIRNSSSKIDLQIANAMKVKDFSTFGGGLNDLHKEIILADGTRFCHGFSEYNESMKFALRFSDSMKDALTGSKLLTDETLRKYADDIGTGRFIASKEFLTSHLEAAVKYEEIMNQSKSEEYVQKELEKENEFFRLKEILYDKESHTPFEVAEATEKFKHRLSGKTTAGTQVEDSVLDYREPISYQKKIAEMNFTESMGKSRELWGGLARLFATNAESTSNDYSQLFLRAQDLLNGIRSETDDEENETGETEEKETILRKYPKEAKTLADKIEADISEKNEDFKDWRKSFSKGEKYRGELKDYDEGTKVIDKTIKELETLLSKTRRLSAQAQAQVRKAEIALDEAKQNYARALSALEKNNFTQARTYLGTASQKYAESFNIQESMSEREESDRLIRELSERIVREENELVIREVRSLINDAQDLYYDGDLELAEKKLSQAQNRWSITNTEKNEEIETLLELVSSARKLQIGRKIKPTDPLYSDMSQLLSVAAQFYEDGEKLMKQGKKEEAKKSLNTAKEKLEPMKLIYPLNDDAAFLRLKIEKLLDPESFQAGFKKRIDDANKLKSAEKLAALENLLKINPSYPGLAKKVEDLQYELGFKTRPTVQTSSSRTGNSDAQNQAAENQKRAESLYAQAQRIFQGAGNNQSELQRASSLLDEIIRIYSRDRRASIFRQATALKDRIQSKIGGTVVAVLTADDEANFQRAQNFVNKGNYDAANDILDALWKKAAARNSKKIIDLRAFVKNRL